MKILITSGIYPPEAGGPATYVQNLAKTLINQGHQVGVISYSDDDRYDGDDVLGYKLIRVKRSNKFLNYIKFFKAVNHSIKNFDLVYCFDHFSAGIPSVLACKLNKKKIAIRVGGDFIWERYLRITKKGITLRDYYDQNLHQKDFLRFWIIKLVFKSTDLIIFTTKFQREIFEKHYNLNSQKIRYIHNPFSVERKDSSETPRNNNILFVGRMIEKNNIRRLISVFNSIKQNNFKLVIVGKGEMKEEVEKEVQKKKMENIVFKGQLSRDDVINEMKKSHAMIFPSYTDISPNTVLECITTNIPFILTTEQGFDWLKGKVLEFNPLKDEEMKGCLEKIMNSDFYQTYQQKIKNLNYNYNYSEASEDTIRLFKELL
jgi:glycosyltransferase involved in cell wall biosynthesis